MPVILTTPMEFERWLEADTVDDLALQRPLPMTRCGSWRRARKKTKARSSRRDPNLHHVRRR
jgi:putative SOS response-associated peptidase YedK